VISCDFDNDFCGYQPNEFVSRISGEAPGYPLSGPEFDHTTGKKIKINIWAKNFIKVTFLKKKLKCDF